MPFDTTVTEMQAAESRQRDVQDPRESDTHSCGKRKKRKQTTEEAKKLQISRKVYVLICHQVHKT